MNASAVTSRVRRCRNSLILIAVLAVLNQCGCNKVPSTTAPESPRRDERWNMDERIRRNHELINHARSTAGKTVAEYTPLSAFDANDLDVRIDHAILAVPGVVAVRGSECAQPASRIIHLIFPVVPTRDGFLIALKQLADGGVTEAQCESLYNEYLMQVKLAQIEDIVIARCLVNRHRVRAIYSEDSNYQDLLLRPERTPPIDIASNEKGITTPLKETRRQPWLDAAQHDYLGELMNWRVLDSPFGGSDSDRVQSTLVKIDRHWIIVGQRGDNRLSEEIDKILSLEDCCLLIGDANDLSKTLNQIAEGRCDYIQLRTKSWQAASPLDPNIWGR